MDGWWRCQAQRCGRSRGGRRQGINTGLVVTGVSRKIVNTNSLEVDEGDLPVLWTSDGAEEMD